VRKITLFDRVNAGIGVAGSIVPPAIFSGSLYWHGHTEYAIEAGAIAFLICAGVAWMWWDAKKHTDGF
jgi:hypothetical protein